LKLAPNQLSKEWHDWQVVANCELAWGGLVVF